MTERGNGRGAAAEADLPSTGRIMSWISSLAELGARTPDSPAAITACELIQHELQTMGMTNVRIEETPTVRWDAEDWSLTVCGQSIPCSPIRHTFTSGSPQRFSTPAGGLAAEVAYIGRGAESDFKATDVTGKIVVCDAPFAQIRLQDHEATFYVHDPTGTHADDHYLNPYDPPGDTFPRSYYRSLEAGAAGYIGILVDYYRDRHTYANEAYSVYEGQPMEIPGLWVSSVDGDKIKRLICSDRDVAHASIVLSGILAPATSREVIGVLPGDGPLARESLIVDAHYDSIGTGAVQDASGCGAALAIAEYFSQVPVRERNRSLVFVFNDTHFGDYACHDRFVARTLPKLNAVFAVSIEHIGLECVDSPRGPRFTGRPAYRIIWTSPSADVVRLVKGAVVDHNLDGAVVVSSDYSPEELGGDTDELWRAGIPVVNHLGVPTYLFDEIDTVDKVAQDQLAPTVAAFVDIISGIDKLPKEALGRGRPTTAS